MANNVIAGHRVKWFVVIGGEKLPRQATMRGQWDYEAECSCGWKTRTGGAVKSYIQREIDDHKWEVTP